jgi:uncharacterized protein YdeI (YjbR/CyaY-like superfamily)
MTALPRVLERAPLIEVTDREGWRQWLERNHAAKTGAWLVWPRLTASRGLSYDAAIEEALCFGWIDGQAAGVDGERSKQYFAPRRARSPWSGLNRARFQRMLSAGRVAPPGVAAMERARLDGSWSILDQAERLEVPPDLATALAARPPALLNWEARPPSARRADLAWIALARRAETRARRIRATAGAAQVGERGRSQGGDGS